VNLENHAMHLVCPACLATNRVPEQRLHDAPVCGHCGALLMAAEPVSLNDTGLAKFIAASELPVLVDFWAAWCGPCKSMAPHFAAAASQMPEIRFVKVDTDAAKSSGSLHHIRGIPTLVLFKAGVEVARQSGAISTAQLLAWVRPFVAADA
jgi:thioredoxin 2